MTATAAPLLTLDDVRTAQSLLQGYARLTPLRGCGTLSDAVGGRVLLKCENLQRGGSFKMRGAFVRIARLSEDERRRGVVAASAGNHGQGVALAARRLGCAATVFMPERAPLPKVAATRGYGAHVQLSGRTVDDALVHAADWAASTGAVLIHPFDHPDVIAGQATIGLELLAQLPEVKTVVAAVGGGGLVGGIAAAMKAVRPEITVVGVQAAGASAFPASLQHGQPLPLRTMATMADGIAVGCPGDLTFRYVRDLVDRIVTVSEDALARGLLLCLERAKLLVEPAGAAAVAAILDDPRAFEPPVVAVLSGGNIDPLLLSKVVQHGMVAAGRYLSLRVVVPDRPGELARLLTRLADSGANVLDVEHTRTGRSLQLDEVVVMLTLETRGRQHEADVVGHLDAAGYRVDTV